MPNLACPPTARRTIEEDWDTLVAFFPETWRDLAASAHALKGLRQDKSAEKLLRTMLIHFACGCSLRETVARARQAGLASLSAVALLKRIRKSKEWLYAMRVSLFAERQASWNWDASRLQRQFRLFDATVVKKSGKTGSLWRIHCSFRVPSLSCDHFSITQTEGAESGESFRRYPIQRGDYIIADRGYCTAGGIQHATAEGGFVSVRVNSQPIRFCDAEGERLDLLGKLRGIKRTGEVARWPAYIRADSKRDWGAVRICAIRKSREAIEMAYKKLRRRASKKQTELKAETLVYAQYVIVATTFPEAEFSAKQILEACRMRWQIELLFKRFKQIAQLGHLPKRDDDSSEAWLYGKLFVALLAERLTRHATSISPLGARHREAPAPGARGVSSRMLTITFCGPSSRQRP